MSQGRGRAAAPGAAGPLPPPPPGPGDAAAVDAAGAGAGPAALVVAAAGPADLLLAGRDRRGRRHRVQPDRRPGRRPARHRPGRRRPPTGSARAPIWFGILLVVVVGAAGASPCVGALVLFAERWFGYRLTREPRRRRGQHAAGQARVADPPLAVGGRGAAARRGDRGAAAAAGRPRCAVPGPVHRADPGRPGRRAAAAGAPGRGAPGGVGGAARGPGRDHPGPAAPAPARGPAPAADPGARARPRPSWLAAFWLGRPCPELAWRGPGVAGAAAARGAGRAGPLPQPRPPADRATTW